MLSIPLAASMISKSIRAQILSNSGGVPWFLEARGMDDLCAARIARESESTS